MIIDFTKKFNKQVLALEDKKVKTKLSKIIHMINDQDDLKSIPNIRKLRGRTNYYRIRLGNYRIGLILEDQRVIFASIDNRSDFYKYFPLYL